MSAYRLSAIFAVVLLVGLPAHGRAQSATTGSIAGVVRDTTGAVLPGVTVEAASPALIEKVRSVVSDERGNYKVVDLRPGAYTVTFTLPGFATYRREGIDLSTGFTATVNGDMKVGSLEETVTVTGASPVVDIQNVRTQTVLSREVLDALPSSKSVSSLGALTLGVRTATSNGAHDVGGSAADGTVGLSIHGGRGDNTKSKVDGMNMQNNSGPGGGQNFVYRPNTIAMQETTMETGGMNAESETGGIQLNYVPRDGGNKFSVYSVLNYANDAMEGSNLSDTLRQRGLTAVASTKKIYDYGVGVGGPIRHDKMWFYTAHRSWGTHGYLLNTFWNSTQHSTVYTPDFNRPAWFQTYERDHSVRLAWQMTAKMKFNISESYQSNCLTCPSGFDGGGKVGPPPTNFIPTGTAPESSGKTVNSPLSMTQVTWSYPRTSRLLFDAGLAYNYFGKKTPFIDGTTADDIGIRELSTGFIYRSRVSFPATNTYSIDGQRGNGWNTRAAISYVTGTHAFKGGITYFAAREHTDRFIIQSVSYSLRNAVPTSLTQYTSPYIGDLHTSVFGYYAQDQWTISRLTLNLGARVDTFVGTALAVDLAPSRFFPARAFPEVSGIPDWKDFSPRLGAAFDVFGNGKTAVKGYVGRYVFSMGIGFTDRNSPQQALSPSSDRTWNDILFPVGDPRRGNFVPDCDLTNFAVNGECGALTNARFGTLNPTRIDGDEVRKGWGARENNWQTGLTLQQELRPGMAMSVGYFRTWYANQTVVDNAATAPTDFNTYCVTSPVNAGLPGGGGQRLCGLYNQNRATFGLINEQVRRSETFGGNTDVFNGVDIALITRLKNGIAASGGVSTGRSVVSTCSIVDSPEAGREGFCLSAPSWSSGTQYKANFIYPFAWGIQFSGNYQNLAGPAILATRSFTNAEIAPSLGRNLSACPANTGACTATATVALIPTDGDTRYEGRLQQFDVRLSKTFRIGRLKVRGDVDVYNVFNTAAVVARNNTYGPAWGTVTRIEGPRIMKIGGNIDF